MTAAMSATTAAVSRAGHLSANALHEDECDERLEKHDRGDDDDQRTGEEPLRHHVAEGAGEAPPGGAETAYRLDARLGRRRHPCVPLPRGPPQAVMARR